MFDLLTNFDFITMLVGKAVLLSGLTRQYTPATVKSKITLQNYAYHPTAKS